MKLAKIIFMVLFAECVGFATSSEEKPLLSITNNLPNIVWIEIKTLDHRSISTPNSLGPNQELKILKSKLGEKLNDYNGPFKIYYHTESFFKEVTLWPNSSFIIKNEETHEDESFYSE